MIKLILSLVSILLTYQMAKASTCTDALESAMQSSFIFTNLSTSQLESNLKREAQKQISAFNQLASNKETPSFKNTIDAYMSVTSIGNNTIGEIYTLYYNTKSKEVLNLFTTMKDHENKFNSLKRESLEFFNRVDLVFNNMSGLTNEEKAIVTDLRNSLLESGVNLDAANKEKLTDLNTKKTQLISLFKNNMSQAKKEFSFEIKNIKELSGLPKNFIKSIQQVDKKTKRVTYKLNASNPHRMTVLTYADSDALRKSFTMKRAEIAAHGANENRSVILDLMKVKQEIAALLGFKSPAQQKLITKMAKTPEKVYSFLNQRISDNIQLAKTELKELQEFKDQATQSNEPIKPWQIMYWANKFKVEKYSFKESEVKNYFSLDNSLNGMFLIANKLYGITATEVNTIKTFHEDVKVYEIKDSSGKVLAHMHADFFSREGTKESGAWAMPLKPHSYKKGVRQPYTVSISTNYIKSDNTLLTLREAETLFHEFGHALHGILSETKYNYFSGTSVKRDFVELPSQFMEFYIWEKESLDLFATHYKTGKKMPDELFEKMVAAKEFRKSSNILRQTKLSLLDMNWHDTKNLPLSNSYESILEFEAKAMALADINNSAALSLSSVGFSHILEGYSAGYYGYAWADLLAEDAFSAFKETGNIFNPKVAKKFRKLLAAGGSIDPLELYTLFRGQAPSFIGDNN